MNRLAEMLALYDREMGPQPTFRSESSPWVSQQAQMQRDQSDNYNARGARMTGALALMNQAEGGGMGRAERPNFFTNTQQPQLPAYVQPQQFGPQQQPQGHSTWQQEMAQRTQGMQGQGGQVNNYLAQLMRRGR